MSLIEPVAKAPTTPSRITAETIRDKYNRGTRAIRNDQLQYIENSCFIEGQQWVYRHNTRQEILQMQRGSPEDAMPVISRLGPESRRIIAKLVKRPLVFEVTPDSPDDETTRGAKTAEGVLTDLARTQKWERIREQICWAAWKGGTAGLCLDWDASAGRSLGLTTSGREMGQGDCRVTALSIVEMATEPGTRDLERADWWVKAQAVPPTEVRRLYDMKTTPPANTTSAMTPMQTKLMGGADGTQNLTLVLTYYERPSKQNKSGTVATVVGDEIVDGPYDWPFPFKDRLNVVRVAETAMEGRWTGRTVVSDAVPIQTVLNHTWKSIIEHLKKAGNARIQGQNGEQHNFENWTDDPAMPVFYDTEKWEWLSAPPMPEWWMRLPAELMSAMDDALSAHDVTRGVAPPNIQSGVGISALIEQDDSPTGRFAQIIADAFSDLATMTLQTYEAKVPEEETRQATVHVPGYVSEKFTWNGTSFAGQTIARVPFEAVAPINEGARWARAQALLAAKIITTPRQLSAFLDIPGVGGEFITVIDPNVTKARRENYQLATGEPCIPAQFDDHAIHIEEHNAFRLSAQYERLDDQTRQLVDLHVQAHSTLAAEEAAQQQLKMQYAPMLAQAAQGTQPPGSMLPQTQAMPPTGVAGAEMGGAPDQQGIPTINPMPPQMQANGAAQ